MRIRMIVKIIIYYLIIFGLLYEGRELKLLDKLFGPVTITIMIFFIYVASYLLLLGLEIVGQLARKATPGEIKKAAFWFSFGAGTCWGILPTFYHGYPNFYYSLKETFLVLGGCVVVGSLFGVIGVALSCLLPSILGNDKKHTGK